jgi:nitroreductase
MDKPANTTYSIHELIAARWSPRAFAPCPVETAKLHRIFEAARWAPSSFNEQPWGFVVATKDDLDAHRSIADCLVEANRRWAELAPVLMISVAKLTLDRNGNPNRHAYHDLGQAVAFMLVQVTDLGLVAHQMGGFNQNKARATLNIPDNYDPVAGIALGYPGDTETLPPELQAEECEPRQRKGLEDFVWSGVFGTSMSFKSRVERTLEDD